MLHLTRLQKILLTLWLRFATALRFPARVRSGIAWAIGLPPLAGADGDNGGDGGDGGDGDDGAGGAGGGGDGDGDGDGWTPPTKAEFDNLQRKAREAETERDKLKQDEQARQRKEAEQAGDHKALLEQAERERDEARQEADRVKAAAENDRQERLVEQVATRLKFKDPTDVLHRVPADKRGNQADVEKALKAIAKEKPYLLVDAEQARTRDVTGDGSTSTDPEPTGVARMARAYAASSGGS